MHGTVFVARGALLVVDDAVLLCSPVICVTFWWCVVWMLWVPEMLVVTSELNVLVALTSLCPLYVAYVYCEPVKDSGTVDSIRENELV